MGTAASGDGIKMQKDQVTTIGANVTDLHAAVQGMASYASGDGLKVEFFGGVQGASDAGSLFLNTVAALAKSVGTAAQFCKDAGDAITSSVKATSLTDEEAMWGLTKAGKGE
jgi:hypothetical protein